MGVDIKPGSSPRSTKIPRYAVVVLRDGNVISRLDDVPLYSLIRLILEYHVDVLAVDNLFELAKSSRDVAKLSKLIPSWCKIIEVTSSGGDHVDTNTIAQKLGLDPPRDSLSTAYVNAVAAYNGIGRVIKLHADRSYVIVSKGRTPSQGGTSCDRFKRSIRASVLRVVREIKEKLESNQIDYDLVVKESEGGLERGFFIVYAPVDKVRNIINPIDYKNVKVKIKSAQPLNTIHEEKRKIIVGLDPGTTIGLAIIDFDGRPLLVKSYKTPDREVIVEAILSHGKPVVIAVDVYKPPDYVKKMSSLLDAILYTPERDLEIEEKQRLVNDYVDQFNLDIPDAHARDALAAALKSFRTIKPLVDEVESKIRGISDIDRDEIVSLVLRGRALSDVLEEIFMKKLSVRDIVVEKEIDKGKQQKTTLEEITRLRTRVHELENVVRRLEEELRIREELLKNLEMELKTMRKPQLSEEFERRLNQLQIELDIARRTAREKDNIIEILRQKISELYRIIVDTARGKYTVVCRASALPDCGDLPVYLDNVIYVEEALKHAREHNTGIIIEPGSRILRQSEVKIPVVEARIHLDLGNYVLIDSNVINVIRDTWNLLREEEIRERRERLIRMIKDYQETRRKGENK